MFYQKKNSMKHILFLNYFILFYFLVYTQPKINTITWVGENKEYLNISKKTATLQKGRDLMQLEVAKYVKNKYIILSKTEHTIAFKSQYNIVRITPDTLILHPEGNDFFELGEPNKQNHYVFVNSMRNYKFVKLHYEILSHWNNEIKFFLDIDSAKKSKVTVRDEYFNETKIYKSPVSKKDYERLIRILSSFDIDSSPDEKIWIDNQHRNSILEIQYNDQKKIFKGGIPIGYSKLADFMWEYISLRAGIDVMRMRQK